MKTTRFTRLHQLFCLPASIAILSVLAGLTASATTVTLTPADNGTSPWTVPVGVTSISVAVQGAGGAGGGSANNSNAGGGGGGGACAFNSDYAVTPGSTVTFTVGSGGAPSATNGGAGGSSTFGTLTAGGGTGGKKIAGAGLTGVAGVGGTASDSASLATLWTGGDGSGTSGNLINGGGGGGAGTAAAGTTATGKPGGAGGTGDPAGGAGGTTPAANGNVGGDGTAPGGGGSGGRGAGGTGFGGKGGNGQIVIVYTLSGASITVDPTLPSALTTIQGVASASVNVAVTASGIFSPITVGPTTGLEFSNDDATWGATTSLTSSGGTLYVRLSASAAAGSYDSVVINLVSEASAATATTGSGNTVANPYWISTASGDWSTTTNWQSDIVANGSGNTADFTQVDLTTDTTVHLEAARTIGNLIFGDTDNASAAGWTVDDSGTPANTLTLAGTTPTVTVNALGGTSTATISAVVLGTSGLTKAGAGTLTLSGANTYTGATTVNAGTLQNGSATTFTHLGNLSLSGTGTFDLNGYNADFTNVAASTTGNIITNNGATDAMLTATLNTQISALITDGPSNKTGIKISGNANSATNLFKLDSPNTFSGGILVTASRMRVWNNAITGVATIDAGVVTSITSSPFGRGPITIGQSTTDPAMLLFNTLPSPSTVYNDILFNTPIGTDAGNTFQGLRINADANILTFAGTLTAGLADVILCGGGTPIVTGKITGTTKGLQVKGAATAVTLNNINEDNDYAGTTTINASVILDRANQIPNGTGKGDVAISGTLNLNGYSETINGLNGAGVVDGVSGTPTLTLGDGNASGSFSGVIQNTAGTLSLVKIGSGTQTLAGANTYGGNTTVHAGKLAGVVGGSVTSPVTVAATAGNTANLGVSITDITKQWSCPSLTVDNSLNGGTGSDLDFNFGALTPGTSVAPLQVNGDVTFTTPPVIRVACLNLPPSSGDGYPLMTWTGTGPTDVSGITLTLPNRVPGNLAIVGSTLYLQITGPSTQPLTYQGGGTWDVYNTYWKDSAGTLTSYMDGLPGDSVVFDATGAGGMVTLDSAFNPASVLVNNASYDISGSGSIGGITGVTKSGSGTLTLSTANTYSGATTVNGGTLALSSSGTLGSTAAPLILSGGALDLGTLTTPQVGALSITAAATSGDTLANGSLTGSSYAVSPASGNAVVSANLLANGAAGLAKSGAGVLTLSGANTYSGATVLNGGELHATSASALGAGALTLNTAATTLRLANDTGLNFGRNTAVSASMTIQSDTLTAVAGVTHTLGTLSIGANTLSIARGANVASGTAGLTFGATTLTSGPAVFDVASGVNLTLGAWTGNFNMTKQNSGILTLGTTASGTRAASVNTLAGGTLVLGGAVTGTQDSLGGPGAAFVLNGGMLDLATDTSVLAHPTTVGGDVTIQSDKASAASVGITHTLGTLSLGANTLTVTGGANVSSGTAGLTFGATTLTGAPTLVVNNPAAGGTTLLTLGAVTPGANTLTVQGNGNFTPGVIGTGGGGLTLDATFSGTVTLGAAHTFTGDLTIKGGTAATNGGGNRLGNGANLILTAGKLSLGRTSDVTYTRTTTTVNGDFEIIANTGTAVANVTQSLNNLALGNQTLTVSGVTAGATTAGLAFGATTLSGAPTFTINNPTASGVTLLKLGAIADNGHTVTLKGSGNFAQTGVWGGGAGGLTLDATYTGTATLNQANTYTGATTVNGGKLAVVTGGGCANSDVSVANAAALSVKASAADTQWACKSLTLSSPGTLAEFDFSSALPSTVTAPLQVNGAVTNNGTLQVTITGGLFVAGTDYPLIKSTGLLTAGALEVVSLPSGVSATLVDNAGNSSIDLHVIEGNLLKWTGDTGDWDIASSYNWNSGAKQYLETTLPGDGVLFDDNSPGAGPFTVTLNTLVTPSVVNVNNSTKAYTISGSGTIGGTTGLSKSGSGLLTLATANTYSGGTIVRAGAVNVQNNTALGSGAVAVAAGAELQLEGGVTTGANPLFLGTIANPTAGVLHSISGDNTYGGVITVPGDASVGAATFQCDAGTLTLSNTIARNNGSPKVLFTGAGHIVVSSGMNSLGLASIVTINGSGTYTFAGTNTLMNSLILTAGTLNINSPTAVGSGGTTTFTISGGTIDNTSGAPVTESANLPIIINGDFAFTGTQDLNLGTGTVGLGANALVVRTITANAGTLTLGGIVSGGAALTKAGNGTLTLTGVNTYSGTTTVNAGTLAVTGSSIANAGKLVINGGSVQLTGAETVDTLFFGATQQAAGTYSADGAGGTIASANFTGTGTLIVTTGPVAGFSSWITSTEFGLAPEDQGATADPDNDGMENQLEYVLNGNPSISDSSILPQLVVTATDFEFTYSRLDLSSADTTQTFEYGDTLTGWNPVVIPAAVGVTTVGIATVTVTDAGSTDTVKVSISKSSVTGSKLFGRLQVVK